MHPGRNDTRVKKTASLVRLVTAPVEGLPRHRNHPSLDPPPPGPSAHPASRHAGWSHARPTDGSSHARYSDRFRADRPGGPVRRDRSVPRRARFGEMVGQHTGVSVRMRGCRLVTTSMTARLLLANQLRSLPRSPGSSCSGDALDDPPDDVSVEVVPIRREFAPSDIGAFVRLWRCPPASPVRLRPDPHAEGVIPRVARGPAQWNHSRVHRARLAVLPRQHTCGQPPRVDLRTMVLHVGESRPRPEPRGRARPTRSAHLPGGQGPLHRQRDRGGPLPRVRGSRGRVDEPVVVMVGRLVREKGCDDFLELARRLRGAADFVHVGPVEADQRDALDEAQLAAAAAYVTFVGAVDDIRPYLAAADVVVQPSYREGIPRVVMEAAAVGHPRGRLRRPGSHARWWTPRPACSCPGVTSRPSSAHVRQLLGDDGRRSPSDRKRADGSEIASPRTTSSGGSAASTASWRRPRDHLVVHDGRCRGLLRGHGRPGSRRSSGRLVPGGLGSLLEQLARWRRARR